MLGFLMCALFSIQTPSASPITATPPGEVVRIPAGDAVAAAEDSATLTPYLPELATATGTAVLVLPGGGYAHLAAHEGIAYARWLNSLGIAAYVLDYRLGSKGHHHPDPLSDAVHALSRIRSHPGFPIDTHRVGVIGSSAGGHLAATLAALDPAATDIAGLPTDRQRPDFAILCYAVVSMREGLGHAGSRHNLIGDHPSAALVERLSIETQVTSSFPPSFVWSTADDPVVSVRNSYALADALAAAHVPHELHVFRHGPHGIGLGTADPSGHRTDELHPWTKLCADWLAENFGRPRAVLSSDPAAEIPSLDAFVVRIDGERVVLRALTRSPTVHSGLALHARVGSSTLKIDGVEDGDLVSTRNGAGDAPLAVGDLFTTTR